jgi:hypothetical protein
MIASSVFQEPVMLSILAYLALFLALSAALTYWRVANYRRLENRRF